MQHPSTTSIKSVCASTSGASPTNPVVIMETYYQSELDSTTGFYRTWYRKCSDGRIEQGGYYSGAITKDSESSYLFVIPFTTTNVSVFITLETVSGASISGYVHGGLAVSSITTSGFTVHEDNYVSGMQGFYWEATGV